MPDQITVTGSTGPTSVVTARAFPGVKNINFNLAAQVLSITDATGRIIDIDLYGVATVTYTVASHLATVSVS